MSGFKATISRCQLFFAFLFVSLRLALCDDILGCGGFIKSHIPIDFSKVEVGLYTKQGSLKDMTDCAPNNGYYFLAIYDHGDYVLKVSAPTGWNFEPTEVSVTVDGESDACSLGKDINFIFAGFAVSGKVVSDGSSEGPADVTVSLLDEKGKDVILKVVTVSGGEFAFPRVAPGRYELRISHDNWIFSQDRAKLIVSPGSHNIIGTLSVAGYPVSGIVTSEKEPISGVSFVLHVEGGKKISIPKGCLSSTQGLCRAESGSDGRFVFPALPPGQYRIVPHYAAGKEKSAFDVRPRELRFTVEHGELQLAPEFQVKGFTVTGKVLISPNGPGVADAKVFLNKEQRALTGHDGSFRVENMQAGTYVLTASAESIQFNKQEVRISPGSPSLPHIVASGLAVCGQVVLNQLPSGISAGLRTITADRLPDLTDKISTTTSNDGHYCLMLTQGNYKIYVHTSGAEIRKGLKFSPPTRDVSVATKPISGINFSPLRATLSGKVACLPAGEKCENLIVTLVTTDTDIPPISQPVASDGVYSFSDVLPGQYEISIKTNTPSTLCWEKEVHRLPITSAVCKAPDFVQTGYSMMLITTHSTTIEYRDLEDKKVGDLHVPKGESSRCVPGPGPYMLVPNGCHTFDKNWYSWELKDGPISMKGVKHAVGGTIISPDKYDDITIKVTGKDGKYLNLGPLPARPSVQGGFEYRFELMASPDEDVEFEPKADKLLFVPPTLIFKTEHDCQSGAITFRGDKGHFVEGKVSPPIEGVEIRISLDNDLVKVINTDSQGHYSAGPLPTPAPNKGYDVSASVEGYQVTRTANGFTARKLAEVVVRVKDSDTGEPLSGVLLSLSGGNYRRNIQAGADGTLTFRSLGPGEYFLKPKLKEYKFEPQSKVFNVTEGATVDVDVSGHRVAFSCIGSLVSLSGEPEGGVSLEAVGTGNACKDQQEEAVSEANGYFRIRGLLPQCEYVIKLKEDVESNRHIARISPKNIIVKAEYGDVEGVRVIAMRPPQHCDVSVLVINKSPGPLLRLRLYREDQPDSPMFEKRLEPATMPQHYLVLPALPNDGQSYYVQVDAAPGSQQRVELESKFAYFVANSSSRHIRVEIGGVASLRRDSKGSADEEESTARGGSLVLLFMLGVFGVAAMYRSTLATLGAQLTGAVKSLTASAPAPPPPTPLVLDEELIVEPVTKRKAKPRKA